MVDAGGLNPPEQKCLYGFDSHPGHGFYAYSYAWEQTLSKGFKTRQATPSRNIHGWLGFAYTLTVSTCITEQKNWLKFRIQAPRGSG